MPDRSRDGRSGRNRNAGCATKIPEEEDNSTPAAQPSATAKVESSHTPPAAGASDTARPAKSTTTLTVVGEAQVRLAPAANGGPLAATESPQTPTASMMQVSARSAAQPSTASPDVVDVATRVLATALAPFVQPGPARPVRPSGAAGGYGLGAPREPAHPRHRVARRHAARDHTGSRHGQRAARVGGRRHRRHSIPGRPMSRRQQ